MADGYTRGGYYPFYMGVYQLVDDPSSDSIISWSKSNKSFVIWNPEELFRRKLLWKLCCFKLSHFIRALDNCGFERNKESEHLEYGHKKYFVRGQPELLKKMHSKTAMARIKRRSKAKKAKAEVEKRLNDLLIK
uniref:Heat stress transcription factor A-2e n=1 Tax=Noccaea caerulescens TaxID=107243 RepID=A0A1J3ICI1_NOCCA